MATHDRTVDGPAGPLPVRIYHPPGRSGVSPAIVWFHAGGCTIGGLHTNHSWCTVLAERAGVLVMSVDYRLAPEHPFPAAVDDALASYQWVIDNADGLGVDPFRVATGGDSAGGTLATVVCQERRRQGQPQPLAQLLAYPGTDATGRIARVVRRLLSSGRDDVGVLPTLISPGSTGSRGSTGLAGNSRRLVGTRLCSHRDGRLRSSSRSR